MAAAGQQRLPEVPLLAPSAGLIAEFLRRWYGLVRGGAASGNRTPDLLITSEPLCPTELRRQCCGQHATV